MSTKEIKVQGTVRWAKFREQQVNKWGKLQVNFYPKDKATRSAISALGARNPIKEDEDGNLYYIFVKRLDDSVVPGAVVVWQDGAPFDGHIGNGSEVELTLQVYTWDNEHGKGTGVKVIFCNILNLVEYKRDITGIGGDLPV